MEIEVYTLNSCCEIFIFCGIKIFPGILSEIE